MTAFTRFHEWSGLWGGTAFSSGQGGKYFLWPDETLQSHSTSTGDSEVLLTFVAHTKNKNPVSLVDNYVSIIPEVILCCQQAGMYLCSLICCDFFGCLSIRSRNCSDTHKPISQAIFFLEFLRWVAFIPHTTVYSVLNQGVLLNRRGLQQKWHHQGLQFERGLYTPTQV